MAIYHGRNHKKKTSQQKQLQVFYGIRWVVPPPSNSGNEGLVQDSLLKMVHNPGGDSYWEGGQPKVYGYM